jgi:hypothetical protein
VRASPEDILQAIFDAAQKALRTVAVGGVGSIVDLGPTSLAALEEVQVNVTGRDGIASETTLAALLALLTPGTPQQLAGTVGVAAQTLTFSGPTKHLIVSNPSKNAAIEISLNGGATFFTIEGPAALSIPCRTSSMQIRAVGGTLPYAVLAMV